MRLTWPFRRDETRSGSPEPAVPRPRDEWRSVPPPRVGRPPRLVTDAGAFAADRARHLALPPVLRPALVARPPVPAARAATGRETLVAEAPAAAQPGPSGPPAGTTRPPHASPRPVDAAGASGASATAALPGRATSVTSPADPAPAKGPVAGGDGDRAPARSTTAGPVTAGALGGSTAASTAGDAIVRPAPPRLTLVPQVQRAAIHERTTAAGRLVVPTSPRPGAGQAPSATPPSRPDGEPSGTVAPVGVPREDIESPARMGRPAERPSPATAPARGPVDRSIVPGRRLGLGEPLAPAGAPTPAASRARASGPADLEPVRRPIARPDSRRVDEAPAPLSVRAPLAAPSPRPAEAGAAARARSSREAARDVLPGSVRSGSERAIASRAPALPGHGGRPLASVQRAPVDGTSSTSREGDAPADEVSVVSMPGGPVRVDRSSSGAQAAAELRANAFTAGQTVVLPAAAGSLDGGRGRALLAHELVHVNQQRRLGGDLPREDTGAGQALEREARSAESLVDRAVPSATRERPWLPLAGPPARGDGAPAAASAAAGATSGDVHRAVDAALAHGARSGGGRGASTPGTNGHGPLGSTPPTSITDASDPEMPQRQAAGSAAAGSAAASTAATGDADLEELAKRLYEHIRYRLGRELLLDRERAGSLTDVR